MLKLRKKLLDIEEDRLHSALDYSVDEVAAMIERADVIPEHEDVCQIIVSKCAAQQLVAHATFAKGLEERLGYPLIEDFHKATDSLQQFPYRNPILCSEVFTAEKYRKMLFDK